MTAVTMIFEMTRDYDIVMRMIVAVAVAIGIRRIISRENIYTVKLVSRRHFIPKALHANLFLVHQAADVVDCDILLLPTDMSLDAFLRLPKHDGRVRHVVVTRDENIFGVLRINTGSVTVWKAFDRREARGCCQPKLSQTGRRQFVDAVGGKLALFFFKLFNALLNALPCVVHDTRNNENCRDGEK